MKYANYLIMPWDAKIFIVQNPTCTCVTKFIIVKDASLIETKFLPNLQDVLITHSPFAYIMQPKC